MSTSLLGKLSVGKIGWCEVQTVSNYSLTLTLMDKQTFNEHGKVFSTLADLCNSLPTNFKYKPDANEMIAAQSLAEDWQRGYVISTVGDTHHVAMVDIGLTEKMIKNVQKLPVQFTEIPILGAKAFITFISCDKTLFIEQYLKQGQVFKYVVKTCHALGGTADLFFEGNKLPACEVELEHWVPRFEDKGLKRVAVKDGALVDVVSYSDVRGIFVRPMDDASDILYQSIIQKVGAHCMFAPNLTRLPLKGDLLASRYSEDGNYYRALVLGFDNDQILVSYVDFGNKEYVTKDRLKLISQKLKELPCMAVLVELKVAREFMNRKTMAFLDGLVISSKLLNVRLEDGLPVDLVLADKKTTVSELVNKYLEPNWKLALKEGRNPAEVTLFGNAVDDLTLPTATTLMLTVLFMPKWDMMYACARDSATTRYVLTQMPADLAEYCTHGVPDRPYLPRLNEVCAVRCDGRWVRAVCCRVERLAVELHLIDFGSTVVAGNSSVRKICDDFVWPQAIAVSCVIEGLPKVKSVELLARLKDLLPDYSNHTAIVTHVTSDLFHHIVMPNLLKTLEQEGWMTGQTDE